MKTNSSAVVVVGEGQVKKQFLTKLSNPLTPTLRHPTLKYKTPHTTFPTHYRICDLDISGNRVMCEYVIIIRHVHA